MALGTKVAAVRTRYDVFLSFRGEDTRKGFTTQLHSRLQQKGLASFIDNERLKRGEVISQALLQAIEGSSISIVILSQNYASSTWCLDELQKIVESKQDLGRGVFPVFYGVDPSDVRHQRGNFEKAFSKHKKVLGGNSEKLRRWRDALTQVANIAGWDSREYQYDAELIERIAEDVWVKLRPKLPSTFDILTGIDTRIEDIDNQVRTGLAKYYNKETSATSKNSCCFIM